MKEIDIIGRGGTSFQPVIDFVAEAQPAYDGLIIFTDGYADMPRIPRNFRTRMLYVLTDEGAYAHNKKWLETHAKVMCYYK